MRLFTTRWERMRCTFPNNNPNHRSIVVGYESLECDADKTRLGSLGAPVFYLFISRFSSSRWGLVHLTYLDFTYTRTVYLI